MSEVAFQSVQFRFEAVQVSLDRPRSTGRLLNHLQHFHIRNDPANRHLLSGRFIDFLTSKLRQKTDKIKLTFYAIIFMQNQAI